MLEREGSTEGARREAWFGQQAHSQPRCGEVEQYRWVVDSGSSLCSRMIPSPPSLASLPDVHPLTHSHRITGIESGWTGLSRILALIVQCRIYSAKSLRRFLPPIPAISPRMPFLFVHAPPIPAHASSPSVRWSLLAPMLALLFLLLLLLRTTSVLYEFGREEVDMRQ